MNEKELVTNMYKVLALNATKFSNTPETEKLKGYALELRRYAPDLVNGALTALSRKKVFFPSISEIHAECEALYTRITGEGSTSWEEAWEEVMNCVRRYGYANGLDKITNPTAKEAVKYMWRELCYGQESDNDIKRAQFRNSYEGLVSRKKDERIHDVVINDNKSLAMQKQQFLAKREELIKQLTKGAD